MDVENLTEYKLWVENTNDLENSIKELENVKKFIQNDITHLIEERINSTVCAPNVAVLEQIIKKVKKDLDGTVKMINTLISCRQEYIEYNRDILMVLEKELSEE